MSSGPQPYTYDGVPTEDSSRGKFAMPNELATTSEAPILAAGETGGTPDEELLEQADSPCPVGPSLAFLQNPPSAQLGHLASPTPID